MDCEDNNGSHTLQNLDNVYDYMGYESYFCDFYPEEEVSLGDKILKDKENSRSSSFDAKFQFEAEGAFSMGNHTNMGKEAGLIVEEDDHDDFPGLSPLRGDCVLSSSNIDDEVEVEYFSRMFDHGRGCGGCENFLFSSSVEADGNLANSGGEFNCLPPSGECMIDTDISYDCSMERKNESLVDCLQSCHDLSLKHAGKMEKNYKVNSLAQGSTNEPRFLSVIERSVFDVQRRDFDSFKRTSAVCCTDESECCTDAKKLTGVISNSSLSVFVRRTNPKRAASLRSNLNDGKCQLIVPSDKRKGRRNTGANIYWEPLSHKMFWEVKRKVRDSFRQARLSVWGAVDNLSSLIKQGHEHVKHDTEHNVGTTRRLKKAQHEAIRRKRTTLVRNKQFQIFSSKSPSSSQPIPSILFDDEASPKKGRENLMAMSDASETCSMKAEQEQNFIKKWYVLERSNIREGQHGEKDMESTVTQETSADSPFFECHGVSSRIADDKQPSNAGNSPDSDIYNPIIDTGLSAEHSASSKQETVLNLNSEIQEPKADDSLTFAEMKHTKSCVIRLPLPLKHVRACESPRRSRKKCQERKKLMKTRSEKEDQVSEFKNGKLISNNKGEFLKSEDKHYKKGTKSKRFDSSDLDSFNNCMEMENRAETLAVCLQKDNNEQLNAFLSSDYIKDSQVRTQNKWSQSRSGHPPLARKKGKTTGGRQKGIVRKSDKDKMHNIFSKENEELRLSLATNDIIPLFGDQMQGETNVINALAKDASVDVTTPPFSTIDLYRSLSSQSSLSGKKAWALCDDCQKWRCVPDELVHIIEKRRWTCKDNVEEAFADCSIPQEKTDDEINNDLGISDKDFCSVAPLKLPAVQTAWARIKANLFLHRNRRTLTIDEIMVCHCKPSSDGSLGCGEECLNRMLNIECVKGTCPCGNLCSNQQFQKRKYSKFKWIKCGKKGYGLQLEENASRGQFLIEYIGEVLDLAAYEARLRYYAFRGQRHFYFMTLNGGEVIDACTKGNLGRYINHSCDPNCRTEKWMVNGEVCIGLFALRDIKKGEEITFDYNYVRVFGAAAKKCVCGSVDCRGYIGGDPSSSEVTVQDDSDADDFEPVMIDEDCETGLSVAVIDSVAADAEIVNEKVIKERNETNKTSIISEQGDDGQNQDLESHAIPPRLSKVDLTDSETTIETDQAICENVCLSLSTVFESSFCGQLLESSGQNLITIRSEIEPTIDRAKSSSQNLHKISLATNNPNEQVLTVPKLNHVMKASQFVKIKRSRVSIRNVISGKSKKVQPAISSRHIEGVEEKLNDLLDEDGGIRRQKDAAKGYLKLLLVTAAAGDETRGNLSQSARDLSLILDAILKTKSRMLLVDIINKNGLQMLHNMMKQNRENFNRIPILRKLLKVLEFLAEKEILSRDHINAAPPCSGMESFKESMLKLIKHRDSQIQLFARNFVDQWIRRPLCRVEPSEKDGRQLCSRNSFYCQPSNFNSWYDRGNLDSSSLVSTTSIPSQCMPSSSPSINDTGSIDCTRPGKRKSRWDQPADDHNLSTMKLIKPSQVEPLFEVNTCSLQQSNENINDDEDSELPPGFESSSIEAWHQLPSIDPDASKEAIIAHPLERYMQCVTISYGMPVDLIQQLGSPETELDNQLGLSWKIAPAMPFKPFPPLPSYPRQVFHASGAQNSFYNGNISSNDRNFNFQQRNTNQMRH